MGKIFNADASKSGLYKIGSAKVSITGAGNAVFLQVDITMDRQLQPIATIGSGIQWAAQPPQGTMTVGTILTNSDGVISALGGEGNGCDSKGLSISLQDAMCTASGSGSSTIQIAGGYCSRVQFTMSGQQGYVAQNVSMVFTEMTVS